MSISVTCPKCGDKLTGPDGCVGKKVKCPNCGTRLVIPNPGASQANPVSSIERSENPPSLPTRRSTGTVKAILTVFVMLCVCFPLAYAFLRYKGFDLLASLDTPTQQAEKEVVRNDVSSAPPADAKLDDSQESTSENGPVDADAQPETREAPVTLEPADSDVKRVSATIEQIQKVRQQLSETATLPQERLAEMAKKDPTLHGKDEFETPEDFFKRSLQHRMPVLAKLHRESILSLQNKLRELRCRVFIVDSLDVDLGAYDVVNHTYPFEATDLRWSPKAGPGTGGFKLELGAADWPKPCSFLRWSGDLC